MSTHADDGALTLDAPICEVTLLEDRARVLRRATVTLPAGLSRVRIAGVAPVLSDKTLTGEVAEAGATVVDARVHRRLMVSYDERGRDGEAAAAALHAELQALDATLEKLEIERLSIERQSAAMGGLVTLTMAELAEDSSWGRELGPEWKRTLDELSRREHELCDQLVSANTELARRRRERQRLDERWSELKKPVEREWAAIEASISATRAGTYTVAFDYAVPGACWRPYHTCRLLAEDGNEPRIVFGTDACVWQSTGEDWNQVELVLSTERASLGVDPPTLTSDVLMVQRKSETVVVQAREQEIQTTGLGSGGGESAKELPGIDDGGVALSLRAPQRSSVPADGKPYRVHLCSFESSATVELVAMPELVPCVIMKSVQANESGGPLLAGPVDLIRHSGFVGRTSVLFIAAGERFELGWGPEADLRIHRVTEVTEEKSHLLSSWLERSHEVELRLSNLGERTHSISVSERIPISEIDKVRIEIDVDETTGGILADKNGLVTWQLTLQPCGHERIALRYVLKKHEDVVGI